jgi:hypothetical protein
MYGLLRKKQTGTSTMLETPSNKGTSVNLDHIYNSFQRYLKKTIPKGMKHTKLFLLFSCIFGRL